MNQSKMDALTSDLASALALVDNVKQVAYSELGYRLTRRAAKRAMDNISALLIALQDDWQQDERELDEDLKS